MVRTYGAMAPVLDPTKRLRVSGYLARVDDDHSSIVYEGSVPEIVFEKIALAELLGPRQ
jgi:hypothetical protein